MTQRIATVTLLVAGYEEALDFYCNRLGFALIEDTDLGSGRRWVLVGPPQPGAVRLLLAEAKDDALSRDR
jgi:catechol 2,3-dioxygenase-like lactoylglutathione lyase family enzyme